MQIKSHYAALSLAAGFSAFLVQTWPAVKQPEQQQQHNKSVDTEEHLPIFSVVGGSGATGSGATTSLSTGAVYIFVTPDRLIHNTVADAVFEARPVPRPLFEQGGGKAVATVVFPTKPPAKLDPA